MNSVTKPEKFSPAQKQQFLLLMAFAAVFLLTGLNSAPLIDWDENIYAEASRQMLQSGDYLNVSINGHPFAEKPPLFFWLQSASYHLFGVNEFAARLPSALAGLGMTALLVLVGSRLFSFRLGWLWALIYLTSFLPALFARTAVIDHSFNLFIALATFSLYLYDQQSRMAASGERRAARKALNWLLLASLAMGLGVLTKGPLAGVIPLAGFGAYKIMNRQPAIRLGHFFLCALISLTIATSWYWINWMLYGSQFILGFIEFQLALFSKPLEGHEGPFFYHAVAGLIGLIPWSMLLFGFRNSALAEQHFHTKPMMQLSLGWIGFVLVLFSLVTTKLPHYSASMYIPLTLLIALVVDRQCSTNESWPKWLLGIHVGWGILVGGVFLAFPILGEQYVHQQAPELELQFPLLAFVTGTAYLIAGVIGGWLLFQKRHQAAVLLTAVCVLVAVQGFWRWLAPTYLQYTQQPAIKMVQEATAKGGQVVFYRYVSFAALFYANDRIEMLHTYKFPGDPNILNSKGNSPKYVVTESKNKKKLMQEHPLVQPVKDRGMFSLLVIPAQMAPASQ